MCGDTHGQDSEEAWSDPSVLVMVCNTGSRGRDLSDAGNKKRREAKTSHHLPKAVGDGDDPLNTSSGAGVGAGASPAMNARLTNAYAY
jgi:hypothetical protein